MPVYEYLESLHLKPTAVNKNGENLLHYLARKPNQQEIIRYFIGRGVSINQADLEGNTPLLNAAATNKDTATLTLLLPANSINQANKKASQHWPWLLEAIHPKWFNTCSTKAPMQMCMMQLAITWLITWYNPTVPKVAHRMLLVLK
nr:ankyrin repeat domain-containing protein [Paraflavitalea speifideiaquila]